MPLPPYYFPVYAWHPRLPEPGLHANPLIQTPPILHLEGLHTIRWIKSDTKQLSSTVLGDGQQFALRNHDSGRFIPHVPLPLCAGPFLYETLQNSKYQVIFHQPNVQMNGSAVGIFQWLIAPPWRCFELQLPLPKFLAKAGRAGAARKAKQKLDKLAEAPPSAQKAAAELAARDRGDVLHAYADADEREREARTAERLARSKKTEQERLARQDKQTYERHEAAAAAQLDRAARVSGAERESSLAAAAQHRAQAQAASNSATARSAEARVQEHTERAQRTARNEARAEQASFRKAAELNPKYENLHQDATGASNAAVSFPSLLAHLPLPATVQIQVSWSQILQTWGLALAHFALEMLSSYVGFVFDGVLAPGKSTPAVWALDLAKSVLSDGAIGAAQKYLMEDKLSIKVGNKLGPVKVGVQFEQDAKGKWTWKLSAEDGTTRGTEIQGKLGVVAQGSVSDSNVDAVGLSMNKETVSVSHLSTDPVLDYGQNIPEVK